MASTDFLAKIIETKRERLNRGGAMQSVKQLSEAAFSVRQQSAKRHAFREAIETDNGLAIIAEFKRASPSKGEIRVDVSPAEVARFYEAGGAAAISVLTEEDYFRGSIDDLRTVRASVALPVLRKDFLIDEYQVYESAVAGADALLLIVAAIDDNTLAHLRRLTEEELGMDALVEVHTANEMRRAHASGATLIGVNNRDLRTFEVALEVSIDLAAQAPKNTLLVSESGLRTGADIRVLQAHGYKGFLIGEALMRAADPEESLRMMIREVRG